VPFGSLKRRRFVLWLTISALASGNDENTGPLKSFRSVPESALAVLIVGTYTTAPVPTRAIELETTNVGTRGNRSVDAAHIATAEPLVWNVVRQGVGRDSRSCKYYVKKLDFNTS
jgi:hypothetical protein